MIDISDGVIKYKFLLDEGISAYTEIKDVICIGYRYTEAGSNPREFQGMTRTNIKILKSILEDPSRFWAKHLGISITIKGGTNNFNREKQEGILQYEDACITNGLQTLSLFRILIMIKIFQESKGKEEIHTKITSKTERYFIEAINTMLHSISEFFLSSITISQINKVLYWLYKDENKRYLEILNKLNINELIEMKISFKAVFLDEIINSEEENNLDMIPIWGGNIADSNNETQNVKEDDKFGTNYSDWFDKNIMKNINGKIVDIEYRRYYCKKQGLPVKHILDILRVVIPTTLIVDYKDNNGNWTNPAIMISKYANNRSPVFSVFEKLITISEKENVSKEIQDVIEIIKNLMPMLIQIMLHFEQKLNEYYKRLTFKDILETFYKEDELKMKLGLDINESNMDIMNKAVKMKLRFSPSIVFPLFIFATRKSIMINNKLQVEYDVEEDDINIMMISIYKLLLKQRLQRQYSSTSDMFRDSQLYIDAEDMYKATILKYKEPIDYTEKYRINLADYQNELTVIK